MLGRTAGGLFWMFRHLERSENTARLIEAGMRIALARSVDEADEWASVIATAGQRDAYLERHDTFDAQGVITFLLQDIDNPSSVRSAIEAARTNARVVRTALTREVWEATNDAWMTVRSALAEPIPTRDLPRVLGLIRHESAIVRGALHGTMLRNDSYDFARLGTFLERADNTARILDVKYYVLLPSAFKVGSSLDNAQWETILRSVAAQRAYRWENSGEVTPSGIAELLILNRQMPRSLAFCYGKIDGNLAHLASEYGVRHPVHDLSHDHWGALTHRSIESIFDEGLHEFLSGCILANSALGQAIEADYRFTT